MKSYFVRLANNLLRLVVYLVMIPSLFVTTLASVLLCMLLSLNNGLRYVYSTLRSTFLSINHQNFLAWRKS